MKLSHRDMLDLHLALAHRREALTARTKHDENYGEDDAAILAELRQNDADELARVLVLIQRLDDERKQTAEVRHITDRVPTGDELAGIAWWNSMTDTERADALDRAGGGSDIPSAADAWAWHKRRMLSED